MTELPNFPPVGGSNKGVANPRNSCMSAFEWARAIYDFGTSWNSGLSMHYMCPRVGAPDYSYGDSSTPAFGL